MDRFITRDSIKWVLIILSWITIFFVTIFLGYKTSESNVLPTTPFFLAIAVQVYALISILLTKKLVTTLTNILVFIHLILLTTWGNLIPYLNLLPFIISYLLLVDKRESRINIYLILTVFFTFLELVGFLPLITQNSMEVGFLNLLLIILLQVLVFTVWAYTLKFYEFINKLNLLGLERLDQKNSHNFLLSTFYKGLYISILLHFFNNFLHRMAWNTENSKNQLSILRFFSESTRENNKNIKIENLLYMLDIPNTMKSKRSVTILRAQTLFLCLYNIKDNYLKHKASFSVNISITIDSLTCVFTSAYRKSPSSSKIWNRNLGTMKQFLQLTGQGNISTEEVQGFKTILTFFVN